MTEHPRPGAAKMGISAAECTNASCARSVMQVSQGRLRSRRDLWFEILYLVAYGQPTDEIDTDGGPDGGVADGLKDERERESIRKLAEAFGADAGVDLAALYRDVLLGGRTSPRSSSRSRRRDCASTPTRWRLASSMPTARRTRPSGSSSPPGGSAAVADGGG